MANGKIVVRVYASDTGERICEKEINEDSRHMERDPQIRILGKSKTLIVLLGNRQSDISTIVRFYRF
jgi:hypothetical protein